MDCLMTRNSYSAQRAIIHFRKAQNLSFPKRYGSLRPFFGNDQPLWLMDYLTSHLSKYNKKSQLWLVDFIETDYTTKKLAVTSWFNCDWLATCLNATKTPRVTSWFNCDWPATCLNSTKKSAVTSWFNWDWLSTCLNATKKSAVTSWFNFDWLATCLNATDFSADLTDFYLLEIPFSWAEWMFKNDDHCTSINAILSTI